MNLTLRKESELTEQTDEEIKILLADANEKIKRLKEAEKNDPEIAALREQVKDLVSVRYGGSVKKLNVLLKALRRQAAVRGIKFEDVMDLINEKASEEVCEF